MANPAERQGQHASKPSHPLPSSVTIVNESTPLVQQGSQSLGQSARAPLFSLSSDVPQRRKEALGLCLLILSAISFTSMSLFVKLSGSVFPSFEIVFARSLIQLILSLIGCAVLGLNPLGKPSVRIWLVFRALVVSIGLALFFYSITQLDMAVATVIFFLGPTFTVIVGSVVLNEPFTFFDGFCSLVCFAGFLLIAKPSFLFSKTPTSDEDELRRTFSITCALAGAIMSAMSYVTVRKVGKSTHFMVHAVYFGAVSTLISPPCLFALQTLVIPPLNWSNYGPLLLVALFAFLGQCLLNEGLKAAPAGPGTLTRMGDVMFAFIFGVSILHEYPDLNTILGSALITGTTTALELHKWFDHITRLKRRRSRERIRSSNTSQIS